MIQQFQIVESRCKVCQVPERRQVDMMLATGWSQRDIMRWLNGIYGEDHFNPKNIHVHKERHLSADDSAVRRIVEEKAKQAGLDVDKVTGFIMTRQAAAETIVHTGISHMLRGNAIPESKDVLAAMKYLDELEATGHETAVDEMLAEFQIFAASVKYVLTSKIGEEQAEEWYAAIYDEFERQLDERRPKALAPGSETNEDADLIEDGEYEDA